MSQEMLEVPLRRLGVIGLLSWLSMLGADFFLHGGLLASLYIQPSPFLLPPWDSFKRIPLGYLSALLLCNGAGWYGSRERAGRAAPETPVLEGCGFSPVLRG